MTCGIFAATALYWSLQASTLLHSQSAVLISIFEIWLPVAVILMSLVVVIICGRNFYREVRAKRNSQPHLLSLRRPEQKAPVQREDSVSLFKRWFRPVPVADLAPHHLGIQCYDKFYLPRMSEEEKIAELLDAGQSVVISGLSGVGKSRTIYEMLTGFEEFQGFTVLRPCGAILRPVLDAMYIPRNRYILILDDLDVLSEETASAGAALEAVRTVADKLFVFATIRKESEDDPRYSLTRQYVDLWSGFKEIELAPFAPDETAEIIEGSQSGVEVDEHVDGTAISALVSFRKLKEKHAALDSVTCPESLKIILRAVKTLRELNQPLNATTVKRICVASLERSQILDEETNRLVAAGFFDVADEEVICNDKIVDEVLAEDMPLIETAVQLVIAGEEMLPLWWAGVALFKRENYYKALRCFEKISEKHPDFTGAAHYIEKLREELNLAPGKIKPEEPEPEAAPEPAEEEAQAADKEKEEIETPQNYRVVERDPEAETVAESDEKTPPESADIPEPEPEQAAAKEPAPERRKEKIGLQRDTETQAQLESWRKEISAQIENRHYRHAIENLHRLLATDYNRPETHMALGIVYAKVNNRARADYHMRKGVNFDKTNPEVHRTYAQFLERIGETNNALHEYLMAGMLEIVSGRAELDAFAKCSELSRAAANRYVNFLSASYYTAILYCLGDQEDAAEFLDMIEKSYGQYPVVDYVIDTLKGRQPQPLTGGDLEARAARKICELVTQEMEKTGEIEESEGAAGEKAYEPQGLTETDA